MSNVFNKTFMMLLHAAKVPLMQTAWSVQNNTRHLQIEFRFSIPANMRPWVYCVGLREGDGSDFDYFWNRYLVEELSNEQVVMLQAAGCTSDEASLRRFLSAIVSGEDIVRPQDFSTAFTNGIGKNEYNTLRALNWLKDNINQTITT